MIKGFQFVAQEKTQTGETSIVYDSASMHARSWKKTDILAKVQEILNKMEEE